ncbi:7-cyano-7-deazaguanine synthase [Mesorhizobium amorphae]|uniref:Uncharacterized protein n=2 Tax=Mesorhizobium amorphae TaxID=71433 RepID=G6Y2L5_9HYPH|nr:hypothetical protein A6B35_31920 [Mesorhizobium amorphae CCNWGS0123]EHH13976.1 hypothetical protein MEA186_00781 [Mesorhizobium amorphae CCNWGS0123]
MAVVGQVSDIALKRDVEIETKASSQPSTFVPGRNLLFLDFAADVLPEAREARRHLRLPRRIIRVTRDCRDASFGRSNLPWPLGWNRFDIHTPLIGIDKAQTRPLAERLRGKALVKLSARELTTLSRRPPAQACLRVGCGSGPACSLHGAGWETFRHHKATPEVAHEAM